MIQNLPQGNPRFNALCYSSSEKRRRHIVENPIGTVKVVKPYFELIHPLRNSKGCIGNARSINGQLVKVVLREGGSRNQIK